MQVAGIALDGQASVTGSRSIGTMLYIIAASNIAAHPGSSVNVWIWYDIAKDNGIELIQGLVGIQCGMSAYAEEGSCRDRCRQYEMTN